VIKGRAFFTSSNTLSVEQQTGGIRAIQFKKAIIATGTVINELKSLPFDHKRIINSDDALSLTDVPKSMIIVGGGYIACEMANMYLKFGSKVTIVYRGERLLKNLDADISEALLRGIKRLGGEVLFKSEVEKVDGNRAAISSLEGKKAVDFDKLLVAVGRVPYLNGLGIEKTKVEVNEEGLVSVDSTMKTSDENIYAIGDIVPGPQLAHKAFREGKVAAEAIAGKKSVFDNVAIPMVVFSDPEIASVGMTEEQARKAGYTIKIGKMPFSASGRAKTINRTDGFVKIIADEASGAVLGVHIVGAGAGDLIAEGTLAMEMGALLEDLAVTIHTHPTLPEAVAESAEDALGTVIHLYRGKKA
jgi:dihydrolipoamide dehydrogenase